MHVVSTLSPRLQVKKAGVREDEHIAQGHGSWKGRAGSEGTSFEPTTYSHRSDIQGWNPDLPLCPL